MKLGMVCLLFSGALLALTRSEGQERTIPRNPVSRSRSRGFAGTSIPQWNWRANRAARTSAT